MGTSKRTLYAFSANLKKMREKLKMTQMELADKIDSPASIISEYETGTKAPGIRQALKIAQALNVSLDDMCDYKATGMAVESVEELPVTILLKVINSFHFRVEELDKWKVTLSFDENSGQFARREIYKFFEEYIAIQRYKDLVGNTPSGEKRTRMLEENLESDYAHLPGLPLYSETLR